MRNSKGFVKSSFPIIMLMLMFWFVSTVSAGFNETMDSILSQDQLTFGAASFLILAGAGIIGDDASMEDAAVTMTEMAPKVILDANDPVTLGQYSYMIMNAYEMKGGLFYTMFGNPRYALRELRFLKIVQGRAYSRMYLSGERAVRILGRIGSAQETENEE